MKKTINSRDYRASGATASKCCDPAPHRCMGDPVIGLKIDPRKGEPFIMPLAYVTAKALAEWILRTLLQYSPEMFAEMYQCQLTP